jgi:tetratricopeptide (TPR) repeat protein
LKFRVSNPFGKREALAGRRRARARRAALFTLSLAALAAAASGCARTRPSAEPPPDTAGAAELVRQADGLYAERASIEKARQAVAVLRRARITDYGNYEAIWKLSKFNYHLGGHERDEPRKLEAFREGIAAGEAAVRLAPDKPEGHFWLGANIGGRAKVQGALYALSSVPDIRREMETVIKLDEGFQAGSAYLALGQLDLELPDALGGDPERAVAELERGLKVGENNALLRLNLARAYYQVGRHADARRQAEAVLKIKPSPDYKTEYEEAAEGARQLLSKLN